MRNPHCKEPSDLKQIKANGLKERPAGNTEMLCEKIIIEGYKGGGVVLWRNRDISAERLQESFRKKKGKEVVIVTRRPIWKNIWGKEKVTLRMANEEDEVGIARGLAWTSVGGDTLQIEVNVMPGKERIAPDRPVGAT